MVDVSDLIGMRFVNGGRNKAEGLDCWGLVMEVFRRHGQELPDFTIDAFSFQAIDTMAGEAIQTWQWERMYEPLEPYIPLVVLMKSHPAYITHAGVYLGGGQIIHTMEATGAVVSLRQTIERRIEGYYRYVHSN